MALAALVGVASCGDTEYLGPPVAEIGFYKGEELAFEPVVEGGAIEILNGPQGGFWTMPTLRRPA